MTLPKNITDAIDALLHRALKTLTSAYAMPADEYLRICTEHDRAALEAAIAKEIQPVEPPTDAEVEAWHESLKACRFATLQTASGFPVYYLPATVLDTGPRPHAPRPCDRIAGAAAGAGAEGSGREQVQPDDRDRRVRRRGLPSYGAGLDRRGAGGGAMKNRVPVTAKVVMALSLIVHSGTDKGDPCGRAVFSALCLLAACAIGYSIEAPVA